MKSICRNCHFLTKYTRSPTGQTFQFVLDAQERKEFKRGNMNIIEPQYALECCHLVWSEGTGTCRASRDEIVNLTSRKNKCFFFPFTPGMLLPAAEKIFQMRYKKKEKWKGRAIGFILGMVATLLTGLILYLITERLNAQ